MNKELSSNLEAYRQVSEEEGGRKQAKIKEDFELLLIVKDRVLFCQDSHQEFFVDFCAYSRKQIISK